MINEINKDLPVSSERGNANAKPAKKLSPEEIEKYENKTIELIKEKNVSDAIKYYASNFTVSDEDAKIKVKELAEKNGYGSNYNKYYNKNSSKYLFLGIILVAFTFVGPNVIPRDAIGKKAPIYPIIFFIGLLVVIVNTYKLLKKK